ncbi:hypothetical protein FF38_01469 [Lucilia cuprina]|uniref:Uncharacterized protein n=1 Tax=Lucilia cuprina TaxID=7375 RepID=A0A0L0BL25_LUCCU|nr:hypothetical protein FF38_01469 [Lucilia cuprina]
MIHSSYLSSKLFLWCEDGRKKLHKLLAKIGITLQDSRESWIHISPALRKDLKNKLDSVSEFYGIENVTRLGVIRQFGQSGIMSAGDCAESIAAILETGTRATIEENNPELETQVYMSNFWSAWDSFDDFSLMKVGVEKAKAIQRAAVSTTNFIFENDLPKDLGQYRLVIVQDAPELQAFTNPLSLKRLATWVFEGCLEKNPVALPMILAILDEKRKTYLVYGMAALRSREDVDGIYTNNHFGRIFQSTATRINAHIRVDTFDTAIIELSRDDLTRFIEALVSDANL